jgi:CHAT domain-containing protein
LHIATHFSAERERPDLMAIALAPARPGAPPSLFSERHLTGLNVASKVVVLDGCASARGLSYPGLGIVGLSRAWLVRGAANVLGTLWPIEDTAGPFFPAFYRQLGREPYSNRAAARALQQAQIAMMRRTDRYAHPKHWAAYTVLARN